MSLIDKEIALIISDAERDKEHRRLAEQIRIERQAYEDIKVLINEVKELCNGREKNVYRENNRE